jgi:hypothetical protein
MIPFLAAGFGVALSSFPWCGCCPSATRSDYATDSSTFLGVKRCDSLGKKALKKTLLLKNT